MKYHINIVENVTACNKPGKKHTVYLSIMALVCELFNGLYLASFIVIVL